MSEGDRQEVRPRGQTQNTIHQLEGGISRDRTGGNFRRSLTQVLIHGFEQYNASIGAGMGLVESGHGLHLGMEFERQL